MRSSFIFIIAILFTFFLSGSAVFAEINIELQVFEGPRVNGRLNSNFIGAKTQPPFSGNGKPETFDINKNMAVLADADYQIKLKGLRANTDFTITQERIWPAPQTFPATTLRKPDDDPKWDGTFNSVKIPESYELWKITVAQGGENGKLFFYLVKNDPTATSDPNKSPAKNPALDCRTDRSKCQYQIQISKNNISNPTIDDPTKPGNDALDLTVWWNKLYCPVPSSEFKGLKDWGQTDLDKISSYVLIKHLPSQSETEETQPWRTLQIRDWHEPGKNYKEQVGYEKFKPHIQFSPLEPLKTFLIKLVPNIKKGTYVAQILGSELSNQAEFSVGVSGVGNRPPVCNAGINDNPVVGNSHTHTGGPVSDPDNNNLICTWNLLSKPASSNASLSNENAPIPNCVTPPTTYAPDKDGTYVLQLTVDDQRGGQTKCSVAETTQSYQCYFGFCYSCPTGIKPPNSNCSIAPNQTSCGTSCKVKVRE